MADFTRVFGESGAKTTISTVDYDGGWDNIVGSQPPLKDDFNSVMNEQDTKLKELAENAVEFYTDSGVADAYVLAGSFGGVSTSAYTDGMRIRFETSNTNTGASTVNVAGLGVKNIKLSGGADPSAGDIAGRVELVYDIANDWAELKPRILSNKQLATAWVVFDGTGTAAISESYNISGIIDNGVGDYSFTFANTTNTSDYVVLGKSERPTGAIFGVPLRNCDSRNRTIAGFDIITSSANASALTFAEDSDYVCVTIFGGQ